MIDLAAIRDGLDRGEFFLEYMPAISLADDRCVGAEALIRWRRATRVVQADDFIRLVEETPLSGLLTYWGMDRIHAELGDWLRANRDAYIGINVPPEILGRGGLAYSASKSGLMELASQIMLEITERGVPDRMGVNSISHAKALGVKVALDDVTLVGWANIAILARCQLDAIKLDKSLIDQIRPDNPAPEWLKPVKVLAESPQFVVIAEGVETAQQAATIRAAGVQVAQGYFLSRPIPAEAFIAFHRGRNRPGRTSPCT
jgi:sensor c-di-GMP phosphodiesterase-like protein